MQEQDKHLVKIGFDKERGQYWAEVIVSPTIRTIWASSVEDLRESIPLETNQTPPENSAKTHYNQFVVQIQTGLYYDIEHMAEAAGTTVEVWVNTILQDVITSERLIEPVL